MTLMISPSLPLSRSSPPLSLSSLFQYLSASFYFFSTPLNLASFLLSISKWQNSLFFCKSFFLFFNFFRFLFLLQNEKQTSLESHGTIRDFQCISLEKGDWSKMSFYFVRKSLSIYILTQPCCHIYILALMSTKYSFNISFKSCLHL